MLQLRQSGERVSTMSACNAPSSVGLIPGHVQKIPVLEFLIYRVCQLTLLASHNNILNRQMAWPQIIQLGPAKAQKWVTSITKKKERSIFSPGQASVPQFLCSIPWPWQGNPPLLSDRFIIRCRSCVPPPHKAVHPLQADQISHSQSIFAKKSHQSLNIWNQSLDNIWGPLFR